MPIAVASIGREHVGAFTAAELARTASSSAATRYRSLQQLFKRLDGEGEITGSLIVKVRPPIIPESRYSSCRTTRSRACPLRVRARTSAAVATPRSSGCPLNTGRRLEGMVGLRYDTDDPDSSDVDLRSRRAHHRHGPT
jgi:hypothetical protein